MLVYLTLSRSSSKAKVICQSSRSRGKFVAKVVGVTSSEGFPVAIIVRWLLCGCLQWCREADAWSAVSCNSDQGPRRRRCSSCSQNSLQHPCPSHHAHGRHSTRLSQRQRADEKHWTQFKPSAAVRLRGNIISVLRIAQYLLYFSTWACKETWNYPVLILFSFRRNTYICLSVFTIERKPLIALTSELA